MAKTSKKVAANTGRQAPTGAWTPATLLSALQRGTEADRVDALKKAGIIDARGNLTKTYKNWGTKVTRTPEAQNEGRALVSATICRAIASRAMLEFDYHGERRVVAPYCHGTSAEGAEMLRAVQVPNSRSKIGGVGVAKLWRVSEMENLRVSSETFVPDDRAGNSSSKPMKQTHCRIAIRFT